jgi:hypothetical protein
MADTVNASIVEHFRTLEDPRMERTKVNIRLTRLNKVGQLHCTIIAAQVIRSYALARRDVGSTPSRKRSSLHSCRLTGAKPRGLLSEMRSSNQAG